MGLLFFQQLFGHLLSVLNHIRDSGTLLGLVEADIVSCSQHTRFFLGAGILECLFGIGLFYCLSQGCGDRQLVQDPVTMEPGRCLQIIFQAIVCSVAVVAFSDAALAEI